MERGGNAASSGGIRVTELQPLFKLQNCRRSVAAVQCKR